MGLRPFASESALFHARRMTQPRWGCRGSDRFEPRVARSEQPWATRRNPFGVGLPRYKTPVFCTDSPYPPKPHLSLSRQGLPTIAHRFIGGTSEVSDGPSPGRGDRNRCPRQSRIVAIDPAAKASVVPTGTQSVVQVLGPTVETVGYCRMSLRDRIQEIALREITLEAPALWGSDLPGVSTPLDRPALQCVD